MDILFYSWPLIAAVIFQTFLLCLGAPGKKAESFVGSTVSALMGYSFTAGFFLLALPRTGYLRRIDDKNLTLHYAAIILMPALMGIGELFTSYLSTFVFDYDWSQAFTYRMENLANALFISSLFYFAWSLIVIIRILYLYRTSNAD